MVYATVKFDPSGTLYLGLTASVVFKIEECTQAGAQSPVTVVPVKLLNKSVTFCL